MEPIDHQTICRASPNAIAADVDGEIVLIDIDRGRYCGFDAIASEIWRRLQAPTRVGDLCSQLSSHFDGDPATIENETIVFVEKLAERGLVKLGE